MHTCRQFQEFLTRNCVASSELLLVLTEFSKVVMVKSDMEFCFLSLYPTAASSLSWSQRWPPCSLSCGTSRGDFAVRDYSVEGDDVRGFMAWLGAFVGTMCDVSAFDSSHNKRWLLITRDGLERPIVAWQFSRVGGGAKSIEEDQMVELSWVPHVVLVTWIPMVAAVRHGFGYVEVDVSHQRLRVQCASKLVPHGRWVRVKNETTVLLCKKLSLGRTKFKRTKDKNLSVPQVVADNAVSSSYPS